MEGNNRIGSRETQLCFSQMSNFGFSVKGIRKAFIHLAEESKKRHIKDFILLLMHPSVFY